MRKLSGQAGRVDSSTCIIFSAILAPSNGARNWIHRRKSSEKGLEILHAEFPEHFIEVSTILILVVSEESEAVETVMAWLTVIVELMIDDILLLNGCEYRRCLTVGKRHEEVGVVLDRCLFSKMDDIDSLMLYSQCQTSQSSRNGESYSIHLLEDVQI